MTREQVFAAIRAHLADELEIDPDSIQESTRFREDLDADSLDLYTLVQELEDSYGVRMSGKNMSRRVSFLIGKDGKIVHVTDSPDPAVHMKEMSLARRLI